MPSLKYQLFFSQGLLRHQTVFGQQLVRIIFRDQTLLFLSTAVPHACQTGSLTKAKQALRAGSALLASRPSTSVAAGSCRLTAAQTLSQGPTAREGAAHLLVSTLPISSSLLLLVPPASHHQRTSHLSSKKAPCTTCWSSGIFHTQRIGSPLTEDSQGKDVDIKLLSGHENTTNYHFVFSQSHGLTPGFCYF